MEAKASQRAAERTHERALANVREEAEKKVVGSLPSTSTVAATKFDAYLKHSPRNPPPPPNMYDGLEATGRLRSIVPLSSAIVAFTVADGSNACFTLCPRCR